LTRLVAAISGGVDSAVATARLVGAGHDVTAVHLVLRDGADAASQDARRVAEAVGVPFEVWDLRDEFQRLVLDDFTSAYAAGLTPNPCLMCNRTIKFGALLDRALERGFDGVATGHYARVGVPAGGTVGTVPIVPSLGTVGTVPNAPAAPAVVLLRAADAGKDQSYVLSVLTQRQLRHIWLPLGNSTKDEVRAQARAMALPVAENPESMDLCFIPDGDTSGWLRERLGARPGTVVDADGTVLGTHDGAYRFTIGQRKGLNLRRPAADGEPRFVLSVDAPAGRVVVGPREKLAVAELRCGPAVWTSGEAPAGPVTVRVQVRAHGGEHDAVVTPQDDGTVTVALPSPIIGVAPGQTAAFYDGATVVGSAVIRQTLPAEAARPDTET